MAWAKAKITAVVLACGVLLSGTALLGVVWPKSAPGGGDTGTLPAAIPSTQPAPDLARLEALLNGVQQHDQSIHSMVFDFTMAASVSAEYREQLAQEPLAPVGGARAVRPDLESSLWEGTLRTAADGRLYVSVTASSGVQRETVARREVAISNGRVVDLNKMTQIATIHKDTSATSSDPLVDVRRQLLLFSEGRSVAELLSDAAIEKHVGATEENIDGVGCYRVELSRQLTLTTGRPAKLRKVVWIAPTCGYLLKRAVAYSVLDPQRPISTTNYGLQRTKDGTWVYASVRFESFPLDAHKPGVVQETHFKNVQVNKPLEESAFQVDLSNARIFDRILKTPIRDEGR